MGDPAEARAWRSLISATLILEEALERQAQRDGGMPHAYYAVLVQLFESTGQQRQMSALAHDLRYSLSRLTHAVTSMEKSGWVERIRSVDDRRVQIVLLTEAGVKMVRTVSPIQAREVRARAFNALSAEQLTQLEEISRAIVAGLDGST